MQENMTFLTSKDGNVSGTLLSARNISCLVKQAEMKSYSQSPKYKFGYIIPKDYEEALKLDELNQNIKWEDATVTEMSQLKEYECFIDAGIYGRDKPPDGHKKIRAHLVFDVKHGGCHKAC
jgi:hypothetical protein